MEPEAKDATRLETDSRKGLPPVPGAASLVLVYGGELGRRYPMGGEMLLGRDETCTIQLAHTEVSRRHARIFESEGGWKLEDLGSTNGTTVNGAEVLEPRSLVNGDLLKLGGVVLKFLEGGNLEALYFEEIHRITIMDGLTGVPNKRYLLEFLEREVARAQRYKRPLSLVMVDVDHFKRVNDTYGHLVGDFVLQSLARVASANTRTEELFARFGGEEFTFVLPETDLPEAFIFCERIRRAVEQAQIPLDEGSLHVTISLGLARLEPGMDIQGLLAAADAQLYRAKGSGRNRTMSSLV